MLQQQSLAICRYCDWVARVPHLGVREVARCPRCASPLEVDRSQGHQAAAAWAVATLLALGFALLFQFLQFETQGFTHHIALLDVPPALTTDGYPLLAIFVGLSIIGLPALYLLGLLYLVMNIATGRELRGARAIAHLLRAIRPWLMSDVFIVAVLVALIKIVTLADVALGPSFFAFCGYVLLMLHSRRDGPKMFWERVVVHGATVAQLTPGQTAAEQGAAQCAACGTVFARGLHQHCPGCPCCAAPVRGVDSRRLQWTLALLASAALLLIPANTLPVMKTVSLGHEFPATIIEGVRQLIYLGSWPIAIVIFVASIVVPVVKILALGWLCLSANAESTRSARRRVRLYRFTEFIGRWSMIDVFVVAVLTALIQAQWAMAVHPGPGAIAFAGVVILTMLAALTFDPRTLWEPQALTVEQGA